MYRVRMAIFLSFACLISIFSQTTYYISSSQGNDANPGTSDSSPWKTISKVNNAKFLPGDKILFNRGDKWAEGVGLVINNSGIESNRITYGAYGTGNKPILSNERTLSGTWTDQGSNIWRLNVSNFDWSIRKLWLDDVSVKIIASNYDLYANTVDGPMSVTANITNASQVQTLSSEYRLDAQTGYIRLYSTTNPGTTYSSIKTYYSGDVILIQNKNYVTIQDIKITRCHRAIELNGASYITIDGVDVYDIFNSAVYATKYGNTKSNYLEIKNCDFNSGIGDVEGVAYEYYYDTGSFGVNIGNGADHASIHNNIFTNFHHTNGPIMLGNTAEGDSATSNYNEVYDNVMDMSGINFGRALSMGGTQASCHDNRFYRNLIIHANTALQVGGYHNYIYYNISHNDTLRGYYSQDERMHINWTTAWGGMAGIASDNYYFNNTIYTCKGYWVLDFGSRNHMFNNLVINYQRSSEFTNFPVVYLQNGAGSTIYQNNKFYSPYVNHSGNVVRYNSTWWGTINNWNSADLNGDDISGNTVLSTNPVTSETTFDVSGDVLNAGIDISTYVPIGFKDREGNLVERANPNIGAIDNSALESTGLNVYLQGSYANGIMKTSLKDGGFIPTAQPYNISPWNYNGNESVQTIPSEIVDWVLVELRSDISSSSIVAKRASFVRSDGSIVDLDGTSKVSFNGVNSGNYYIVIKHRNHLPIMSASKVSLSSRYTFYDFTNSLSKAYGNESMVLLANQKYGMYAGDGDANDTVNVLDYGTVGNNLFQTGYFQGDLDLNGTTNVLDYGKANQNLLKVSNVP